VPDKHDESPEKSDRLDPDRQQWLERVSQAAESAAQTLRDRNDPLVAGLLQDLNELHARLTDQLRAS
jgi:hypothetical protein